MLVERMLAVAAEKGYVEVRLDTLPGMRAARRLYAGVGFEEVEAYHATVVEGLIFMGKRLSGEGEEGVGGGSKEAGGGGGRGM